jgi:hypothetical protein
MSDSTDETSSLREAMSDLEKLVDDILIHSAAQMRSVNAYLDRRLALIDDFVGGAGLSTVDEHLASKLAKAIEEREDISDASRRDILAWCDSNLLGHARQTQTS